MKTLKTVLALLLFATIPVVYSGCADDGEDESCEQQDMNEILTCDGETNVEVCCVAGAACVYKFDGQDYPDTDQGRGDLAEALGCTYKSVVDQEAEKELIIERLIALRDKARIGLY